MATQMTTDQLREAASENPFAHPETYSGTSPISVNKLGHFVYEVADVDRSARFWTEVMGFHEVERNEKGMVFFRCGADHHAIGLVPGRSESRPPRSAGNRVEHLAFEVDSLDDLFAARDFLKRNQIPIVFEGRKGAGCNISLNFMDPDGYEFEIYCQMDQVDESGRLRPADQFRRAASLEEARDNPVPESW